MNPMIVGGILNAGLSIIGADAQNRKIENQANMNFNATLNTLDQQFGVTLAGLENQASEINNQIGSQLSNLNYEARAAKGQVVSNNVERNIYGRTAQKTQAVVAMSAAMAEDQIIQAGESAAADIGSKMATAKYSREAGIYQASNQRATAMSQMQSSFEIATGALKAGISGAKMGQDVKGMF